MLKLDKIEQVFLVGIGGIGMSALARYFHRLGCGVSGYDKTETALTQQLSAEGILVFYRDDIEYIPAPFQLYSDRHLVIYTPAIPSSLKLVACLQDVGYAMHKRSEVLGIISADRYTIAVAGTHGKTTTSSLIAHILTESGRGCSAFLGGIASNYDSNVLFSDNDIVVVEADEFDRSFLTLQPNIAVVTSTDPDHLDIYGDHAHLQQSFQLFVEQVADDGLRIVRAGLQLPKDVTYAAGEAAEAYADAIRIQSGDFYFDYHHGDYALGDIRLGIPGKHNVENAVAAITVARQFEIQPEALKGALASFRGVKRRFEYVVKNEQFVYIDDYAHHPAELNALIEAVRSLYPEDKLVFVFQPHLFSRTRDFADDFARALSRVDVLLLMDIYPARELPIEGIESSWLLEKVTCGEKHLLSAKAVIDYLREQQPKLVVTAGAGNIDLLVQPIKEVLYA